MKNADNKPVCDVVMPDFMKDEVIVFPQNGAGQTPNHSFPEFTFKSYAPIIFRRFRKLYKVKHDNYKKSFCSWPLRQVSNPGASGSMFYVTYDDKFIMKTLTQKESKFLQRLLPGYHLNLKQNPNTLLPKFFGLYSYQCNSIIPTKSAGGKKITKMYLVGMNNLIPSNINIHKKYDLKGSTLNRKASENEKLKKKPTFKDLDFREHYPDGVFLNPVTYKKLIEVLRRDCKVLEVSKIMDYSFLMGVHYVDRDEEEEKNQSEANSPNAVEKEEPYKSVEDTLGEEKSKPERESPTAEKKNAILIEGISQGEEKLFKDIDNAALPLKGLHALSRSGERLLLFVGIIDVLQSFNFEKKLEHMYKSTIHGSDTVSVHKPDFYASRFLDFMTEYVKCICLLIYMFVIFIIFLYYRKVFKIGMFSSNQWLSEFEDDSPGVCTDCPDSFHTGKGKSSTFRVRPDVLQVTNMDIYYLKLLHLLFV